MLGDAQLIRQANLPVIEEANLKLSLVQAAFRLAPAAPGDFQHDGVCILEGLADLKLPCRSSQYGASDHPRCFCECDCWI